MNPSPVDTVQLDTTMISLEGYEPYAEALAPLRRLREERADQEATLAEETRIANQADMQAITAVAASMIGEGSEKAAQAARARFDQAQAKVTETQRRLRALTEATRMQEEKAEALLPAAKDHVKRIARAMDEPFMQLAVEHLRAFSEAYKKHRVLLDATAAAMGGYLYGCIAQPNFPNVGTEDDHSSDLWIIISELRREGYDV